MYQHFFMVVCLVFCLRNVFLPLTSERCVFFGAPYSFGKQTFPPSQLVILKMSNLQKNCKNSAANAHLSFRWIHQLLMFFQTCFISLCTCLYTYIYTFLLLFTIFLESKLQTVPPNTLACIFWEQGHSLIKLWYNIKFLKFTGDTIL